MAEPSRSLRTPQKLRFGVFELDLGTGELRKRGVKVRLQGKPFQILQILLERPGEVVTREELRSKLWDGHTFVEFDRSLNVATAKLRSALGDSAETPRFVETLPRRGYRFIASVDSIAEISKAKLDPPPPPRRIWRAALAGGVLLLMTGLVVFNFGWLRRRPLGRTGPVRIESVAVLPLESLSHDPDQEFFADGMTDELITDLSKIGGLQVISRTSVMQYRRARKLLPEIAKELKVDALLEGTVVRSGNRVRITAHLIEAMTGTQLWTDSYERDLGEVLALQDEVARDIAARIRVNINSQEQARLADSRPVNPEAYEDYLRGRYHLNKRTHDGINQSLEDFGRAIKKDPNSALAYAGLAESYFQLADYGFLSPKRARPKAQAAIAKAVELNGNLAEVQAISGVMLSHFDWNWVAAERAFKRAIELNRSYTPTYHWYTLCLLAQGRVDEAVGEAQLAQKLDPLSLVINTLLAFVFHMARRDDQAILQARRTIELDANYPYPYFVLGMAFEQKHMFPEAIAAFEKLVALERSPIDLARLAHGYAVAGRRDEALKLLGGLTETSKRTYVPAFEVAAVYTGLGETNRAFACLESFLGDHSGRVFYIKTDPRLDPLRADPRFKELLRRMGIPE